MLQESPAPPDTAMPSGVIQTILTKRARHLPKEGELDATAIKRDELFKLRNRLTRATDEEAFESAAVAFDKFLDELSEGVGKDHNMTQDECDAEATWLCEMLLSKEKNGLPGAMPVEKDALNTPSVVAVLQNEGMGTGASSAPPKKKARTGTPGTPGTGEKKELVTWTRFFTIPSKDMGIEEERAASADKEVLKECAKKAKAYVTTVEKAKEIIHLMNTELGNQGVYVDPERITSDLVTTRTVKSDHLKFWYLKPNFKDKEVDLLLRVARHKSGVNWEVSYGKSAPNHTTPLPPPNLLAAAGAPAAAVGAAGNALAEADKDGTVPALDEGALVTAADVNQMEAQEAAHDEAAQMVKAVVVTDEMAEAPATMVQHEVVPHEHEVVQHHHEVVQDDMVQAQHQDVVAVDHHAVQVVHHDDGMHHAVVPHHDDVVGHHDVVPQDDVVQHHDMTHDMTVSHHDVVVHHDDVGQHVVVQHDVVQDGMVQHDVVGQHQDVVVEHHDVVQHDVVHEEHHHHDTVDMTVAHHDVPAYHVHDDVPHDAVAHDVIHHGVTPQEVLDDVSAAAAEAVNVIAVATNMAVHEE